ncbi:hypothetical protein ACX0G9_10225 [Flavitalea flava]
MHESSRNPLVKKEIKKEQEEKNEGENKETGKNEIIKWQLEKNEILNKEMDKQEKGQMGMTENDLLTTLLEKAVNNGTGIKENKELIRKANGQFLEINGHVETLMLQTAVPYSPLTEPQTLGEAVAGLGSGLDKNSGEVRKLTQLITEVKKIVAELSDKLSFPVKGVEEVKNVLREHAAKFQEPYEKTVHHKHFMGKTIWILCGLIQLVLLVGFFWNKQRERANQYLDNDSKWRWLKLTSDPSLLNSTARADSVYLTNPESFRKIVYEEEERRKALFEKQLQRQENEMEIRKLEKMEKKEK